MGIDTEEDDFGPDCVTCFPAGQAPRVFWATFTGIKVGDLWTAGDGQPPNGTFKLINIGSCVWIYTNPPDTCVWDSSGGTLDFVFGRAFVANIFTNFLGPLCTYFFANFATDPATTKFYDGLCSISYVSPSTGPSIQRVLSLVNIKPGPEVFAEVVPVSEDIHTYRIARRKDGTNINIKVDYG